jgi:hypothetical protein
MRKKIKKEFQFSPNVIQVIYEDGSIGFKGVEPQQFDKYMKMKTEEVERPKIEEVKRPKDIYEEFHNRFEGIINDKSIDEELNDELEDAYNRLKEYTPEDMQEEGGFTPTQQELEQLDPYAKYRDPASVDPIKEFLNVFKVKKGK